MTLKPISICCSCCCWLSFCFVVCQDSSKGSVPLHDWCHSSLLSCLQCAWLPWKQSQKGTLSVSLYSFDFYFQIKSILEGGPLYQLSCGSLYHMGTLLNPSHDYLDSSDCTKWYSSDHVEESLPVPDICGGICFWWGNPLQGHEHPQTVLDNIYYVYHSPIPPQSIFAFLQAEEWHRNAPVK